MKELTLPMFLLAENPTEDYNKFVYIYSPVYMSLILIIAEDHQTVVLNEEMRRRPRKTFHYEDEIFEFVIIQNNVLMTGGHLAPKISEDDFLDQAWEWWESYLIWEDGNTDENESSKLN
jgi:hypothetical protein